MLLAKLFFPGHAKFVGQQTMLNRGFVKIVWRYYPGARRHAFSVACLYQARLAKKLFADNVSKNRHTLIIYMQRFGINHRLSK